MIFAEARFGCEDSTKAWDGNTLRAQREKNLNGQRQRDDVRSQAGRPPTRRARGRADNDEAREAVRLSVISVELPRLARDLES